VLLVPYAAIPFGMAVSRFLSVANS
jgi:hypothetical protein